MAQEYRQRLNLEAPTGEKLFIVQREIDSAIESDTTLEFNTTALKLTSGNNVVNNLALEMNANKDGIAAQTLERLDQYNNPTEGYTAYLAAEIANREAALVTLQATREQHDSELQTSLTNEIAARTAKDTELTATLSTEVEARLQGDYNINNNLTSERFARTQADNDVRNARIAGDNTLDDSLDEVVSQRQSGDAAVQALIDSVKSRVDGMLALSTAQLDSFHEIQTAYESADTAFINTVGTLTTRLTALQGIVNEFASNL